MASVKKVSRKMTTSHTWFWHVRLINKDGVLHNHPGWVVKVEREGRRGFNANDPKVVEGTWKEAIANVSQHVDWSEDSDAHGYELTADILEWRWGKADNVAELC